ncbi:MAG: UbiX family flavin prenyltransferase [Desulfovibrio sp.]|nr:UbiX family flavin prenyltransferase [Desulfovibrio sp.]
MPAKRLLFAVSGASGMPLAACVLEHLRTIPELEIHLLISQRARTVIAHEQGPSLEKLAHVLYAADDLAAAPASGSWLSLGMIICPCSMASLAAIATGCGTNLIHRAADCMLKERRPLVLVPRETPLNRLHLTNMLAAHDAGAILMPFMPAFYTGSCDFNDLVREFSGRLLDQFGVEHTLCRRWQGSPKNQKMDF